MLDAVLQRDELDFMVLCSSLASVIGLAGQVDYAAANAFLDAFAYAQSAVQGTFTTCINWDAWRDVGMAAKAASQSASIGDPASPPTPVNHPLFDYCQQQGENQAQYVSQLDVNLHWVLDEHRLAGQGLLPGTAYLEMARAAWAHYTNNEANTIGEAGLELRNVYFLTPLIVETEKKIHTLLKKKKQNHFEFQIQSLSGPQSNERQNHAIGEIVALKPTPPRTFNLHELEAACSQLKEGVSAHQLAGASDRSPSEFSDGLLEGSIQFGPRWNTLKWIKRSETEGLALLESPDAFKAELSVYPLHPALLDFATGFLMMCLRADEVAYIPFSYRRLTIKGGLSNKVYSHIHWINPSASDTLKFNIVLMDDQGVERIDIEDYALRRRVNDDIAG